MRLFRPVLISVLAAGSPAFAAPPEEAVPVVQVVGGLADPDEHAYRRMLKGVEAFEKYRHMAPDASLRFRLYPRLNGVNVDGVKVAIQSESGKQMLPLDEKLSFVLPRDAKALEEGARVTVNRKSRSFAWVPEVRTPGLPPNTRRLGDLRLGCEIDRAATLMVGAKTPAYLALETAVDVCMKYPGYWLYYGERPLFNVTLADGKRRQAVFSEWMYGNRLPKIIHVFYDFYPVLTDRAYTINLADSSWSDDTLVELDYMEDEAMVAAP